jgi:type II secretory pathway pseudopilin PulG
MTRVMTTTRISSGGGPTSNEHGWALLGLLLALGIMSMLLVSTVVPNVQMHVQRDREVEMIYRGEHMAAGIARYYGRGNLTGIQLLAPPPYGYLTELSKLKDGVTMGVREIKFVRSSAMIDPMTNSEWEPVRARDPRIMKFLQAWAAETLVPIPTQYLLLAAPPQTSIFKPLEPSQPGLAPPASEGEGRPTPPNVINPPQQGRLPARPNPNGDTDDDDDEANDPLGHLFSDDQPGHSNAPIVGVAPRKKGTATRPYCGLDQYEDWVFLYIPKTTQLTRPGISPVQPGNPPRQVSQ